MIALLFKGTDIASALQFALNNVFSASGGNRLNVKDIMIFITDGASNLNTANTVPTANVVHDQGIIVFTIGVGSSTPAWQAEQYALASGPVSDHFFTISSFSDLAFLDSTIVARTCQEPPARKRQLIS